MKTLLLMSGGLAALAIAATLLGNPYLTLFTGIPAYLVLPGLLIQLAFRRRLVADLNLFLYSVGLSLFFWTIGGLGINAILPTMGIIRPLSLVYILSFYILSVVTLGVISYWRGAKEYLELDYLASNKRTRIVAITAIILPILSVLGSTTLNNRGTGAITITMLIAVCCYVMFLVLNHKKINRGVYPLAIFGIGLALLLMYSMRSWHVLGWDINNELRAFTKTLAMDRWQMSYYPGFPYNACLSLTVLPTELAHLFHLPAEYVFKLLYQIIFAVLPIGIYSIARRFLIPVLALLAAILFVAQNWFFELMPALARQEIALLFFTLFVVALVDPAITRRYRNILLCTFALGLIVSHYSTAYIWLLLFAISYVFSLGLRLFSGRARRAPHVLALPVFILGALALFLWEGPITHTVGGASAVATNITPQLASAFSPGVIKDGIQSALIAPPAINTDATVGQAYKQATLDRDPDTSLYYPAASYASYQPKAQDDTQNARDYLPHPISTLIGLGTTLIRAVLNNIMTVLGITVLLFYVLRRNRRSSLEFIALSAVGYCLIAVMLIMPYLQQTYNLSRLGLQVFIMLVIPAIAGLWFVVRRNFRFGLPAIGLVVIIMLATQSGLVDQITGGSLRITLSQPRGTFDTFYIHSDEVDAAQWLGKARDTSVPVFSDSIAAFRLRSFMDYEPSTNVFPPTIPRDSYVYLIDANTKLGHSFYEFNNNTLTYNTPTDFLAKNKDLIYSSGGSEIYR